MCIFLFLLLIGPVTLPAEDSDSSSALPEAFRSEDLLWEITLGTHQYSLPRVDSGQVFIGTNDLMLKHPAVKRTGGGILMCLEQSTGQMVWQLPIPRYMEGTTPPYHFNQWKCGICSRPAIEGKRLYLVGPRGEILCVDRKGQADGNDGPFQDEREYLGIPADSDYEFTAADGDIIWRYNMITELDVIPHDVCGNTVLLHGDYVYASTSNGQDDVHKTVPRPLAPSLIALDKKNGRLVAVDGEKIGTRMFHGHWSSPVAAEVNGREMILFGGGDGVLYAFEPADPSADGDKVQTLKKIWQADCNPAEYREKDGQPIPYNKWTNKSPEGPSEIIATPVIYKNRAYVTIGQSPVHGPGRGALSCVDLVTGDMVWQDREVDRALSDVLIEDGLLYICDFSGHLDCINPDTDRRIWRHQMEAGVWCCSPVIVDGKLYVSNEQNVLWVLKAGPEKQVISRSRLKSMGITPIVHDGVMYLPTQRRLFAIKVGSESVASR